VLRTAGAQRVFTFTTNTKQPILSLNFANNGQHLSATVGQQIEITLGTVGPKQYGSPQVSSPAVRFESVALAVPTNPGGPTYVYIFDAAAEYSEALKYPPEDLETRSAIQSQIQRVSRETLAEISPLRDPYLE
jgi:hypothetical protein